jgi:hypothetical protein
MKVMRRSLVWLGALVLLVLVGCGSVKMPAGEPFMTGEVTAMESSRVLIEEKPGVQEGYKCWLAVSAETKLMRAGAQAGQVSPASAGDLVKGSKVQAWVAGAVAESYPCQGAASAIVIR